MDPGSPSGGGNRCPRSLKLYDALERGDLTIANMKDKYSALETLALAQNMSGQGTCLQWTDSLGQRMLTFELPGCLHECQETESLTGRATFRCLKVLSLKALDFRLPFSGHVREQSSACNPLHP